MVPFEQKETLLITGRRLFPGKKRKRTEKELFHVKYTMFFLISFIDVMGIHVSG